MEGSMSKNNEEVESYSIFIEGELVDLCVPSKLAIFRDGWADWFNDSDTTRYLNQGIFPNTIEDQLAFYEGLKNKTRLALLIRPKKQQSVAGVISLSNINMFKRDAQIAMVLGLRENTHTLYALESMAKMTEHGFEKVGLERIYAGQAFPALKNWNKRLELLGYKSEGIMRKAFNKGHWVSDTVSLSVIFQDYCKIKELRNGQYWLGEKRMNELIDALPEEGFAEILNSLIEKAQDEYFSKLEYI